MFQQHQSESLYDAWNRFKDLLRKVPHHGLDLWLQVQIFYDHVNYTTQMAIDDATGGRLRKLKLEEAWKAIEDLAQYEEEEWNDPTFSRKGSPDYIDVTLEQELECIECRVESLMRNEVLLAYEIGFTFPKRPYQEELETWIQKLINDQEDQISVTPETLKPTTLEYEDEDEVEIKMMGTRMDKESLEHDLCEDNMTPIICPNFSLTSNPPIKLKDLGPSTSGNQEQDDEFDFWTDSYASDDDVILTKQVSQDIMEEISLTTAEAKLKKMADEMLRQRCTSGDEHQYHIDQMKGILQSDIIEIGSLRLNYRDTNEKMGDVQDSEKVYDPLALVARVHLPETPLRIMWDTSSISSDYDEENSGNVGRNNRRDYVQGEFVEGMNATNETANVQRIVRTPTLGTTSTAWCNSYDEQNDFSLWLMLQDVEKLKNLVQSIMLNGQEFNKLIQNSDDEAKLLSLLCITIDDDQINSNIQFDFVKGNVNSGSVEKDTHVYDQYALETLARNAYDEAAKQQRFAQKVQQQNMTLTSQIEMYKERNRVLENITKDNNYLKEFLEADERAKRVQKQVTLNCIDDSRDYFENSAKKRDE
ncbi:hypothetical protein Tco_1314785 [Tanacetum coccineum]